MDQIPQVVAGLNFSVEARCPHCQVLNKYQQLSAIHTNTKNNLNKTEKTEFTPEAKCTNCDKRFKIMRMIFM